MQEIRHKEVIKAATSTKRVGVIMGTLGRQGSPHILKVAHTFTKRIKTNKRAFDVNCNIFECF